MCTPECTSWTRQHPCMWAEKEGPAIHYCPRGAHCSGWAPPRAAPPALSLPRCGSLSLSSSSMSFSMPLCLFVSDFLSFSASLSVALHLPLDSQSLSASYLSSPQVSLCVSDSGSPVSLALCLSLFQALRQFFTFLSISLSLLPLSISLSLPPALSPVFLSFSLLPREPACQGFLKTPTIAASAGKGRDITPSLCPPRRP